MLSVHVTAPHSALQRPDSSLLLFCERVRGTDETFAVRGGGGARKTVTERHETAVTDEPHLSAAKHLRRDWRGTKTERYRKKVRHIHDTMSASYQLPSAASEVHERWSTAAQNTVAPQV